jgi:4-amino-4-deoxychorismate lyase
MCLLLETIRVENGRILNLDYHNRRFNASRNALFGGTGPGTGPGYNVDEEGPEPAPPEDLSRFIRIPGDLGPGTYRCRVLYRHEIEKVEFLPFLPRSVRSLKLVVADDIDYSFKYADRKVLESLFAKRDVCDEILIVKNGYLTDTSVSNIVFRQADGSWVTPDTPLLNGTMRMYLLETGRIAETAIKPEDLPGFTGAKMINCMMDLESGPRIEMDHIVA